MADHVIPFWTLSSGNDEAQVPESLLEGKTGGFTLERIERLRKVLAAYADDPPVVLERHAVTMSEMPRGGRVLASSSPLLKSLKDIVGATRSVTKAERSAGATGVLYRMVLPKQVAGQLASGLARPMNAGGGAIYGGILSVGKSGILANAKFIPVAAAGAGSGAAGGVVATATVGSAVIAAAPMVVLLAATAASVYAEEQRRRALERLQRSLDDLKREFLDKERDELNGAIGAISKATSILADEGRLGASLGLDSAVHAIDTAVARAERRLQNWERSLAKLNFSATPKELEKEFEGIQHKDGEFTSTMRMAAFAIAMKRRVAVLQAAEHTQINSDLTLARFARDLAVDVADLDAIEQRMTSVLSGLTALHIKAPHRFHDVMFLPGEVRELLAWAPRLQHLAAKEAPETSMRGDVELSVLVDDHEVVRVLEPAITRDQATG